MNLIRLELFNFKEKKKEEWKKKFKKYKNPPLKNYSFKLFHPSHCKSVMIQQYNTAQGLK